MSEELAEFERLKTTNRIKAIPNYPGYWVTPEGKVWSTKSNKWRKSKRNYNDLER